MKKGFNNEKYVKIQSKKIKERKNANRMQSCSAKNQLKVFRITFLPLPLQGLLPNVYSYYNALSRTRTSARDNTSSARPTSFTLNNIIAFPPVLE